MKGNEAWPIAAVQRLVVAAMALALVTLVAACAARLTGEEGRELLGVQVERSVSSSSSAPLLPRSP